MPNVRDMHTCMHSLFGLHAAMHMGDMECLGGSKDRGIAVSLC
jgi:hypothetical protein